MERKITILYFVVAALLAIAVGGFSIQTLRLYNTKLELERTRAIVERSINQQRAIESTIDNIELATTRTGEALSRATTSVAGLRNEIEKLEAYVNDMENWVFELRSNNSRFDDNFNFEEVKGATN